MILDKALPTELQNSNGLLAQIINSAAEGVICLDPSGRCTFVNQACLSMLGYNQDDDLLGRSLHDFIYCAGSGRESSDKRSECRVMASVSSGEEYFNPDEQLIRADGSLIRTSYRARPLLEADGSIVGGVVTFSDITQQKSLEEQLRQAQKLEAIGALAGGVAHDFNNILTAIIGFGSLMEMKMAEDDPMMKSLQQILAAADRASDLTRSLLAFTRKQMTDMRIANLNSIVQNLEKMLRRVLREDVALIVDLCQEDAVVMVDAGQIEQVMLNLATNAGDALPKGGEIRITTARCILDDDFSRIHGLLAPGPYVLLSFADNGTGMDEATAAKVFAPFYSTKAEGQGNGLGLPVCYGIIRSHNGYIECHSEKGAGTVFRVYLPEVSHGQHLTEKSAAALTHLKGSETILLAEDDPAVRALSRKMLEQFGYSVLAAADGDEALQLYMLNRDSVALSILDVIMPKKGGAELFRGIRAVDAAAPILFISGYSDDFLSKQDLPAGIKLIKKPVPPAKFLEEVRSELNKYPQYK